jgi:hypothetical protein
MTKMSIIKLVALTFVTLGIYGIFWEIRTAREMRALGADIPTAWLILVPFANIYWMWKYCSGVEHVTGGKSSGIINFLLMWFLSVIALAIIQDTFNNLQPAAQSAPVAPVQPYMPTSQI